MSPIESLFRECEREAYVGGSCDSSRVQLGATIDLDLGGKWRVSAPRKAPEFLATAADPLVRWGASQRHAVIRSAKVLSLRSRSKRLNSSEGFVVVGLADEGLASKFRRPGEFFLRLPQSGPGCLDQVAFRFGFEQLQR